MAAPLKAGLSVMHTHAHTQIQAHTLSQVTTKMPAGVSMTELDYTASVLHDKEADIEMARWCCSFVGDCMFFLASVLVCSSVWMSEEVLAEGEREGASSGQSGPLYISRRAVWDTIPTSVLDFIQLPQCTSHSGCWEGGGLPSAVLSSASQFEEEVIHFLIDAKLLCHLEWARCWGGKRELIKMLSAHIVSLFTQLLNMLLVFT